MELLKMIKKLEELKKEDVDDIHLGQLISNVNRYFTNFIDKKLAKYNITHSQAQFLMILKKKDHVSQEEICNILGMTEGTVARTIKRLEDKEFLTREINPNDKRKKIVILTEKGENIINDISKNNIDMKRKLESNVAPEEIREFKITLIKIVETIIE